MSDSGFHGVPPAAIDFITELSQNNDRRWFERHRDDYTRFLLKPMRALVGEFADWMNAEVDAGLETRPQVGRAVGRIYRDLRFSPDKRPYKETAWVIFRNPSAACRSLGFYWELTTTGYCYGMGFYSAPPRVLRSIRETAMADPERFLSAVAPAEAHPGLRVSGTRFRRTSMPGAPPWLAHWLDRKQLYAEVVRPHDEVLHSRRLVEVLWDAWDSLVPLYRFLRDAPKTTQGILESGREVHQRTKTG